MGVGTVEETVVVYRAIIPMFTTLLLLILTVVLRVVPPAFRETHEAYVLRTRVSSRCELDSAIFRLKRYVCTYVPRVRYVQDTAALRIAGHFRLLSIPEGQEVEEQKFTNILKQTVREIIGDLLQKTYLL